MLQAVNSHLIEIPLPDTIQRELPFSPQRVENNPYFRAKYLILKNREQVHLKEIASMLKKINQSQDMYNRFEKAKDILSLLYDVGVKPNDYIYRVVTDIYISTKHIYLLNDLLQGMKEHEIAPTPFTSNKIIKAFGKSKDTSNLATCYLKLRNYQFHIDQINYNTFIEAAAKCGEYKLAGIFLEELTKNKFHCDKYTWTSMMKAAFNTNQFALGIEHFKKIESPDARAYNFLIIECCKSGSPTLGETYLQEMQTKGLTPRIFTCQKLIDAFYKLHQPLKASQYVRLKLKLKNQF